MDRIDVLDGVLVSPLKRIEHHLGDILHGIKKSDQGYNGFGEAYFSTIIKGEIKGWNRHRQMTMNLVVPIGSVTFVLWKGSEDENRKYQIETLSLENYQRLTIPPGIWVGFRGNSEPNNLILNIADLEHDPHEKEFKNINECIFDWNNI